MAGSCGWLNSLSVMIEKEMGYSRREFLNQFKFFSRELNYSLLDNLIIIEEFPLKHESCGLNSSIHITLNEMPDRSIGSLNIPRLSVKFIFKNYSELQKKAFFKKFDFSFQRGGG